MQRIPPSPTPTFLDGNSELSHRERPGGGFAGRVQPAAHNNGHTGNEENLCTSAIPSVTHCIRTGFASTTVPPERQPALGYTIPISLRTDSGDAGGSGERPRQELPAERGLFQKGSAEPKHPRTPIPSTRPRTSAGTAPLAPLLPHAATAHGRPTRYLNFPRQRPAIGQFEPKQPPDWSV